MREPLFGSGQTYVWVGGMNPLAHPDCLPACLPAPQLEAEASLRIRMWAGVMQVAGSCFMESAVERLSEELCSSSSRDGGGVLENESGRESSGRTMMIAVARNEVERI